MTRLPTSVYKALVLPESSSTTNRTFYFPLTHVGFKGINEVQTVGYETDLGNLVNETNGTNCKKNTTLKISYPCIHNWLST